MMEGPSMTTPQPSPRQGCSECRRSTAGVCLWHSGLTAALSRMRAAVYGDEPVPMWFDDCMDAIVDAARVASPDRGLLDRIREEVREAVIEGDAQDCSSPDCIADAVYEIVRVALASPAASADGGLRAALDWLRRAIDGRCSNPRCPSEHEGDAPDCVEFHLAAVEALASPAAPAGLDEFRDALLAVPWFPLFRDRSADPRSWQLNLWYETWKDTLDRAAARSAEEEQS